MNKAQRERLTDALEKIENAAEIINSIREEEQDKFDNIPENLQSTQANKEIEANAEKLENIQDCLADIKQDLYVLADL